jgi:prepilin-type N-terminal cleavage/methylation domain-containing protein/prepilin-type processing-associated H-X9-DG protein
MRKAFTLVELLVVIAIMAILIGLLLAGVQNVRAAAARLNCNSNLKQLALACHNYESTFHRLPVGHRGILNLERRTFTGWLYEILPYVEQDNIFRDGERAFGISASPFNNPPHQHIATVIRTYSCPSDQRVATPQVSTKTNNRIALTSYLGVSGLDYKSKDGVFIQDRRITFNEVTDGLSNTLMIGERPPSVDFQFGWWYAGVGQVLTGSADQILGVREHNLQPIVSGSPCGPGVYSYKERRLTDPCGMFHFWGPHPGGGQFAMADGSVRQVPYTANPIMPALASRAGGEVAGLD